MRTFWLVGKEPNPTESFMSNNSPIMFNNGMDIPSPLPDLLNSGGNMPGLFSLPKLNSSYLSLFQEAKDSENNVRRDAGYRSAPTISFREFFSPSDCML